MKKVLSVILCMILFVISLLPCASAFNSIGTTYYVSASTGSDENNGKSPDKAWKTLAHAGNITYEPGDRILLAAGEIFTDSIVARGNGTVENPIVLSSYGDCDSLGKPAIINEGTNETVLIKDVDGWVVENLDISAPNGKGVHIRAEHGIHKDFIVRNCDFHDVDYKTRETSSVGKTAPLYLYGVGKNTHLENITLKDISIRDCGYGIFMRGTNVEYDYSSFVSPEASYNQNFLFENITMNDVLYDGIGGGGVNGLTVRNCALIRTSLNTEFYTAPIWFHHTKNALIENCEVAGATNYLDGMTIDVDGWSSDCTFQYIYSHDNIVFMKNCVYEETIANRNCVVRYCLSVNDDQRINSTGLLCSGAYENKETDVARYMESFKFYNNTIINTLGFDFGVNRNSIVMNNIFVGKEGKVRPIYTFFSDARSGAQGYLPQFTGTFSNNCYVNVLPPHLEENAIYNDPQFCGIDLTNKNSFKLFCTSALIGKGELVPNEDMGNRDFYGNPIDENTKHNIGCYEGNGEAEGKEETAIDRIQNDLKAVSYSIKGKFVNGIRLLKLFFDRTADFLNGRISKDTYFSLFNEFFNCFKKICFN